jgi:hypothetical protein
MMNKQNTVKTVKSEPVKYTLKDCGCYVDSARGIYAIDAIVRFAESHGWQGDNDTRYRKSSLSEHEYVNDIEDHVDNYMNADFSVDGASWGRNDQGDWGLWAIEE